MPKTSKTFTAALELVRSPLWRELGQRRNPLIRTIAKSKLTANRLATLLEYGSGASVYNDLNKQPHQIKFSFSCSTAARNTFGNASVTFLVDTDSADFDVEVKFVNEKNKATYDRFGSKFSASDLRTPETLLSAMVKLAADVLARAPGTDGLGSSNALKSNGIVAQPVQASVAVAGTKALLPALTKWENTAGGGYELNVRGTTFKIWKRPANNKWVATVKDVDLAFPKLKKAFPYSASYVGPEGVLVNDRGSGAECSTPAKALAGLVAALKLTLIRNTNADAQATAKASKHVAPLYSKIGSPYTVTREFTGHASGKPQFVLRKRGNLVDTFTTAEKALTEVNKLNKEGKYKVKPVKVTAHATAVAATYPKLKPLSAWEQHEDDDNVDGGLYYTFDASWLAGDFIIALEDTGWIVIHEYHTQQALGRTPDGRFFASTNTDVGNKSVHFSTADEAWYALNAIWKKLDVRTLEKLDDALPRDPRKAVTASSYKTHVAVAEDSTLPDRVASIVYGDLKRIKSTIAAWKGKMPEDQYKEFVKYQTEVAKFIAKTFVPKMSKDYQAKTKAV